MEVIHFLGKQKMIYHAHMKDTVLYPENVAKYGVLNFVFEKSDLPSASGAFRAWDTATVRRPGKRSFRRTWMWITVAFSASKTKTPFLREKSAWREPRTY